MCSSVVVGCTSTIDIIGMHAVGRIPLTPHKRVFRLQSCYSLDRARAIEMLSHSPKVAEPVNGKAQEEPFSHPGEGLNNLPGRIFNIPFWRIVVSVKFLILMKLFT